MEEINVQAETIPLRIQPQDISATFYCLITESTSHRWVLGNGIVPKIEDPSDLLKDSTKTAEAIKEAFKGMLDKTENGRHLSSHYSHLAIFGWVCISRWSTA